MTFLAVEGCILQSNVTPFIIESAASPGVKINNKGIYRKELKINFTPGAQHQTGGTLNSPVSVIINPRVIQGTKIDDELPLAVGDQGSGTGSFQVGDHSVTKTITVSISDAGQATANCT